MIFTVFATTLHLLYGTSFSASTEVVGIVIVLFLTGGALCGASMSFAKIHNFIKSVVMFI